ncbi:MAG: bifunctional diaminohydroxyphosphoribosylaminopyrimidine deaminase/5-amino-6-(5-phosphoribosylamino)uracil reductase RibD [Erythrobacter sp.]
MPHQVFSDADWIAAAARLSQRGIPMSAPNPSVGCIIVKDGRVLARGWTQEGGRPHAEAHALQALGGDASGADIYVSLEPCAHVSQRGPSCADLLVAAAPKRVIIGQLDPDPRTSGKGVKRLKSEGIVADVLDSQHARQSLSGYMMQAEHGRPFITLKLAVSSDGFIARKAPKNQCEDQWITGEEARAHVHSRRAKQDAILVGGGTWRADNPRLDVRLPGLENRSPTRYLLTRNPPEKGAKSLKMLKNVDQMTDIHTLYVEGGAQTAQSFLEADLVDRIELYTAPITIGDGTKAPAGILPAALQKWQLVETCQLGSDHFAAYQRKQA